MLTKASKVSTEAEADAELEQALALVEDARAEDAGLAAELSRAREELARAREENAALVGALARLSADLNRARSERRAAAGEAARERERHRRTAEEADLASEALKAAIGALERQVEARTAGLAESEARSREVLESLGELLYTLGADGRVRIASRAALQAWNAPVAAVVGRKLLDAFPQAAGSATWEAVRGAQDGRHEIHLSGLSPITGRWVEVDAYPGDNGGVTVAFRDVEERRRDHIDRVRAEIARQAAEAAVRERETRPVRGSEKPQDDVVPGRV